MMIVNPQSWLSPLLNKLHQNDLLQFRGSRPRRKRIYALGEMLERRRTPISDAFLRETFEEFATGLSPAMVFGWEAFIHILMVETPQCRRSEPAPERWQTGKIVEVLLKSHLPLSDLNESNHDAWVQMGNLLLVAIYEKKSIYRPSTWSARDSWFDVLFRRLQSQLEHVADKWIEEFDLFDPSDLVAAARGTTLNPYQTFPAFRSPFTD